jgi:type IV secretory pathway VirB10-like protein
VAEKTIASPDGLQLRGSPLASARLSKRAALAAIAVLAVILGVIIMNVSKEKPNKAPDETNAKKDLEPALNAARSLTKDVPDVIAEPPPARAPAPALPPAPASGAPRVRNSEEDARLADTAVPKFAKGESTVMRPAVAGWSAENPSPGEGAGVPSQGDAGGVAGVGSGAGSPNGGDVGLGGNVSGGGGLARAAQDLNRQDQKLGFQRTRHQGSYYLNNKVTAPLSPFELKTGTVIPGVLIGSMNSDLPGEIIAQVSRNVYDTASGNHLLIPQGTRLFGHYDSNVTFGQGRLLVSWDRLIFPNAYTLDLDGMSGHDEGGSAGYADRVNEHYARIFGAALLTSVLAAGYQLSQPQQSSLLATQSNGQVIAGAVGQQVATVGTAIAQRNLQVQPTIEIRKGYRMNVMVNKDIVFAGDYAP